MSAEQMRKLMEAVAPSIEKRSSCGCGPNCKCGGRCGGRCGDENCPCECGQHTGIGINECGLSVYEDEEYDDSEFDWKSEMESGIVISDNTRGGYDLTADGKYIDNYSDWDDVTLAAKQWMEQNQYWPNIFFINDHGNVTHMDIDGNEIDSIV